MAADPVSVQRRLFIARKDPVSASARLDINGAQLGVPLSTLHANDQPGMMVVRTRMMRKQTIASPLIITTSIQCARHTRQLTMFRSVSFHIPHVAQTSVYDTDCDATSFGGVGHAQRQRSSLNADCRPSGPVLE